jgi:predicted dehydrogenase
MLRIGLIGAGLIGRIHAAAWKQVHGARLVAISDVNEEAANRLATDFEVEAFYDAETMIDLANVDVVDICVPTYLHEQFVVMAVRKGKHVLCEKPIAQSISAADRIIEEVSGAGVKFMVAQVLRFWPEYVAVKKLVDSGELGQVLAVNAMRISEQPTWGKWFQVPELGGSALVDLFIHDLDFITWLRGSPKRIYGVGIQADTGAWNHVLAMLSYEDGAESLVEASWLMPRGFPFMTALRVLGVRGCVEVRSRVSGNVEARKDAERSLIIFKDGEGVQEIPVSEEDAYLAEIRYFASCVLEDRHPTVVTPRECREVLRLAFAVKQSMEEGKVIDVP